MKKGESQHLAEPERTPHGPLRGCHTGPRHFSPCRLSPPPPPARWLPRPRSAVPALVWDRSGCFCPAGQGHPAGKETSLPPTRPHPAPDSGSLSPQKHGCVPFTQSTPVLRNNNDKDSHKYFLLLKGILAHLTQETWYVKE